MNAASIGLQRSVVVSRLCGAQRSQVTDVAWHAGNGTPQGRVTIAQGFHDPLQSVVDLRVLSPVFVRSRRIWLNC